MTVQGRAASANQDRGVLRVLTCGSVDDGKSTLIGRLLVDLDLVPVDQWAALERDSRRAGMPAGEIDLAFLLDGLEAEREQGITIDIAYRYLPTPRRAFVVADAPGHEQYTRNMATAASVSDLALILVDASKGILPQTRRHSQIASKFGIRHVVLAINKIDRIDHSAAAFGRMAAEYRRFAADLGFDSLVVIPVSARHGDNIARRSTRTGWYDGPTVLEWLEQVDVSEDRLGRPLRIPVQWICRHDGFRGVAGTMSAGRLRVGDRVAVAESGRSATVSRIVAMHGDRPHAAAGDAVMLALSEEVDVGRGDVLCAPEHRSAVVDRFACDLLWFAAAPMMPGRSYLMKLGTRTVPAAVTSLEYCLDVDTGAHLSARMLQANEIGACNVALTMPVAMDAFRDNRETGSFIFIDRTDQATVGAGTITRILPRAENVRPQRMEIDKAAHAATKGHRSAVLWLTGLPGAGKSTIANLVERRLYALGCHTYLLDGDNVRGGLNRDLGFTEVDRIENVRRVGEVARLFVDAGLITIVSLISPYRAERRMVRERFAPGEFHEVFIDTPVEICRQRDPKGLYAKAMRGELVNFTGVDAPYEAPERPELRLSTTVEDAETLAEQVVRYLQKHHIVHV
jgi:bifunctional enzyme CysN/CysC